VCVCFNFSAFYVLWPLIPLAGCPKVQEGRIEKTDTHTDTQDNYCNPRCTCMLWVDCTYCSIAAESDIGCRYLCFVFVYIVPNCSRAIMSVSLFAHCTTNYHQAINCLVCSPHAPSTVLSTHFQLAINSSTKISMFETRTTGRHGRQNPHRCSREAALEEVHIQAHLH